jgi:hypothetical protein
MEKVNIGEIIKKVAEEKDLSASAIARKINKTRQAVQAMYRRPNINSSDLQKLSEVLNYDFFKHFIMEVPHHGSFTSIVSEPAAEYQKLKSSKKSIPVLVELDGSEELLKKYFSLLTEMNKAVRLKPL